MNKYLLTSPSAATLVVIPTPNPYNVADVVTWTLSKLAPVDATADVSGATFVDVAGMAGIEVSLDPAVIGLRAIMRLSYDFNGVAGYVDFMVEASEVLVTGVNSYQPYFESLLTAEEIAGVDVFKGATKSDQVAALVNAYEILNTMSYVDKYGEYHDLGALDAAALDGLEPNFLRALKLAQIIEANEMLDVNSLHYKRQDGLMSETIGESSMMFRPGNINNYPITRRSMAYLRQYVLIRARLYRA